MKYFSKLFSDAKEIYLSGDKTQPMLKTVVYFNSFRVICLLVLFAATTYAQPFQKAIGLSSFEKGAAVQALPDGGFIIAGETENPSAEERDMLLLRVDSSGNLLWSKTYGGPERETVNDVVRTRDNGLLLTSEKYQPDKQEGENLTLIKTDANGNLQWKKIFDEGGNETEGFSMQPTPDKGYILTGMVKNMSVVSSAFFNMSAEDQGLYMLKLDENGNALWSRRFSYGEGNTASTGTSVIVAKDGSYLAAGNIARQGRTDRKIEKPAQTVNMEDVRNVLLIKVKPNGSLQWAREYKANRLTVGYSVIEKKEGGFLLAGNTSISKGNLDIFLMNLDKEGNVIWSKTFGGSGFESLADVLQTPDGGFVVSGMTQSSGAGSIDVLNFKVDKEGNLQWAKTYGGESEDYPSRILITKDGIVVVGTTASFGSRSFDVLFFKTDFNGNSGNLSKEAKLSIADLRPVSTKIEKAEMKKVEQGVFPPNMKLPDVNNIIENNVSARVKNLNE